MQLDKKVVDRLDNPPIIKNKKPIDLGDMPEDMDLELVKVAIFGIVESVLISYQDDDIHKNTVRHNIANEIWKMVVNEGFSERIMPHAHEMGTDELAILEADREVSQKIRDANSGGDFEIVEIKEENSGRSDSNDKSK